MNPQRPPSLKERLLAPEAPPPWGQFSALTAFALVIFSFILGAIIILPAGVGEATLEDHWLALMLGALFALSSFAARFRLAERRAALRLSLKDQRALTLGYFFGWGLLLSFALDLLCQLLVGRILPPPALSDTIAARAQLSLDSALMAIIFLLVAQPLVEEILLRGILYPALRARAKDSIGLIYALLTCALAHTVLHNFLYVAPGNSLSLEQLWLLVIAPLSAGFAFSIARAASQSTLAAIVMHAGMGGGALLKLFLL